MGWQTVDFSDTASLYIVNTCTVTQTADQKSRNVIRAAKKRNPRALLVVTGCAVENEKAKLGDIAEIDLLLANRQKAQLPVLADEAWRRKNSEDHDSEGDGKAGETETETTAAEAISFGSNAENRERRRTRAMLKIQDGCRQFCSFCIIPYVRRDLWSMPQEEALRRVGELAGMGYREVVLLGIHLGAYGQEARATPSRPRRSEGLTGVFRRLLNAYPQIRFRLGSIEPTEATESLFALIRDYPNACKHLHLPLQSGDDGILRAMNRPYRTEEYRETIKQIREMIPDIAITTDVLVGFPGEGEEEFHRSLAFAGEMAFSRTHVFVYSSRPGTAAADMPDSVQRAVKERRSREFIRLGEAMGRRYGESWIRRRLPVLLEEESGGVWIGHSDNYLEVTYQPPEQSKPDPTAAKKQPQSDGDCRGTIMTLTLVGSSPHKSGAWEGVCCPP